LTSLDPSNDDDLAVVRAVARFLLTEQLGSPPSPIAVDTSADVLRAMMRTGHLTMVIQVGLDAGSGQPGRWLHVKVVQGGMDAYIDLDDLLLAPGNRHARTARGR
jgi:hypothetical protein